MSFKKQLRTIFVCFALELAVMSGATVRPDEIRALMQQLNQPAHAQVLPSEREGGDGPAPDEDPRELKLRW